MRLLQCQEDGSVSLTQDLSVADIPPYAILSHTWSTADEDEVTFRDLAEHPEVAVNKPGYRKIAFCVEQARRDGLDHFWIDACCIDKANSAELTEALNSMFRWYARAEKCYVFLTDVEKADDRHQQFKQSRWFTRGWTLQELLAPAADRLEFFTKRGTKLGTKASLEAKIHEITTIPIDALRGASLSKYTFEERMRWTVQRQTKKEEDIVYSLFGIFDVFLPPIYGEGREHALLRLRAEATARTYIGAPGATTVDPARKGAACLEALAAQDQSPLLSQILERSRDSCSWIFANEDYKEWLGSTKASKLLLTANAGCGKTTIAAHVIKDLTARVGQDNLVFFHLFHRATGSAPQTASELARSLLYQMFQRIPSLLTILVERHDALSARGDFEWSWEQLSALLSTILMLTLRDRPIRIVIDAYDECEQSSRQQLLEWIDAQIELGQDSKRLRVFVTSRPDGGVLDELYSYPILAVNPAHTDNDMDRLIRRRLDILRRRRRLQDKTIVTISKYIRENARGLFIWVLLVFEELGSRRQILSDEAVITRLTSIPLVLADLYEAILRGTISGREDEMWRIFRWVLYASRELTLSELKAALCFELQLSSWHDFEADVRALCGSFLVCMDEQLSVIHLTARHFLEARLQADCQKMPPQSPPEIHNTLGQVCLGYVLQDSLIVDTLAHWHETANSLPKYRRDRRRKLFFYQRLKQHPFLSYAVYDVAIHLIRLGSPSDSLVETCRELMRSSLLWLGFNILLSMSKDASRPSNFEPIPSIIYAVNNKLPWLTEDIVTWDPHAVQYTYNSLSALHYAAGLGCLPIARLLVRHGASLTQLSSLGGTSLDLACMFGRSEMVAFLVKTYEDQCASGLADPSVPLSKLPWSKYKIYDDFKTGVSMPSGPS